MHYKFSTYRVAEFPSKYGSLKFRFLMHTIIQAFEVFVSLPMIPVLALLVLVFPPIAI